ncbi:MAG: site-specific DNA-methyltransferase, partial [Pseudomonadota bacterium]
RNLLIEGDNFDALRYLRMTFAGRVKCILIDPPYNTGKEFIYPDNYAESLDTYLAYAGLVDDEGKKFSTNTPNEGRFHTKWLNMMYPRLYLARNLLTEDGVIFISIDDNEVANIRKIYDEVFSEENFVGQLIWKRRASSAMADNNVSTDHEYVVCYQKGGLEGFFGNAKDYKSYSNPDSDPRGSWVLGDLTVGMSASRRPNQAYNLVNPKTGKVYPFNPNRVWAYIPESMEQLIEEERIVFPEETSMRPMIKRFKSELKSNRNPFSSLMMEKVGLNTEATRIMQETMGGNVFEYSKPVSLLKTLILQICDENAIIMDFFAGSCVTAHAILEESQESNNHIKFIMVQLPEPCDENSEAYKAGFKTIADIGKERIRRVIKKIEDDQAARVKEAKGKLPGMADEQAKLDLGFKVLKLDRSNFKVWEGAKPDAGSDEIARQLKMFVEHIKPEATQEDILYELLLKAGYIPTEKIERLCLSDKMVYAVADKTLFICLEDEITGELINAVAEAGPLQFICLDKGFKGNDQLKANAVQTFAVRNQSRDKAEQIVFRTV